MVFVVYSEQRQRRTVVSAAVLATVLAATGCSFWESEPTPLELACGTFTTSGADDHISLGDAVPAQELDDHTPEGAGPIRARTLSDGDRSTILTQVRRADSGDDFSPALQLETGVEYESCSFVAIDNVNAGAPEWTGPLFYALRLPKVLNYGSEVASGLYSSSGESLSSVTTVLNPTVKPVNNLVQLRLVTVTRSGADGTTRADLETVDSGNAIPIGCHQDGKTMSTSEDCWVAIKSRFEVVEADFSLKAELSKRTGDTTEYVQTVPVTREAPFWHVRVSVTNTGAVTLPAIKTSLSTRGAIEPDRATWWRGSSPPTTEKFPDPSREPTVNFTALNPGKSAHFYYAVHAVPGFKDRLCREGSATVQVVFEVENFDDRTARATLESTPQLCRGTGA